MSFLPCAGCNFKGGRVGTVRKMEGRKPRGVCLCHPSDSGARPGASAKIIDIKIDRVGWNQASRMVFPGQVVTDGITQARQRK